MGSFLFYPAYYQGGNSYLKIRSDYRCVKEIGCLQLQSNKCPTAKVFHLHPTFGHLILWTPMEEGKGQCIIV